MIRIAICDDERIFAKKLKSTVDSLFEKNIEFQSCVYTDAHQLAVDHNENEYQLIFLDIEQLSKHGFLRIHKTYLLNQRERCMIWTVMV